MSAMGENSLTKFQNLLRTLFQFDSSDLDFGIYRILNYKRDQVEAFITERLPQIVDQAFGQYAEETRKEIEAELEKKRREIRAVLGEDALEGGRLKETYWGTPLGRQYLELEEKAKAVQVTEELKTRVYNDLYTFFSRYYEDGDFISKRRYGRQESYAIPYNGEEVVLYWANRDQYYVKTVDRFKAYRFKVGDYSVAFELRNVAPENGNGGKKRYFVLAVKDPITWDQEAKTLTVAFEYRPLTEPEEEAHGKTEGQKVQDSLNEAAEKKILEGVADENLREALKKQGEDGSSLLRKHLTRFTRKNTADFFIHKDLRGFLLRELDFFLKNEVLLLDELIGGGEKNLWQLVSLARVERQVAEAIIDFLAQVEDFQKKLWEKRKFVLRTEYCLTIDRVPEKLWDEVLANEAQINEWRQLYSLNVERTKDFLKAHPTLVVDTRHFPEDFKWRLLEHFDDLESALDGLLIKSENWQALNLLLEKYREKVKCIYIDPPYNTGSDDFLYKDRYQHSSWLSMMVDRLALGKKIMSQDGGLFVSSDYNEEARLRLLLEDVFGAPQYRNTIVTARVKKNIMERERVRSLNWAHGYLMFFAVSDKTVIVPPIRSKNETKREKWHAFDAPGIRPTMEYELFGKKPPAGRHWMYSQDRAKEMVSRGELRQNPKSGRIEYKVPESQGVLVDTNWTDLLESDSDWGFVTEKNTDFLERLFSMLVGREDAILDFFAGSGTTAHAVINLNREDGGRRRYILVEMGDWFETVMLPRIKKVVFCEKWKDGKPQGGQGTSHMLKYHYLEQYEDTLNNLELPREKEGQLAFGRFGDEYLLRYMLEFETQGSPSLLNLEMFKNPFAYKLKVQEGDEIVERPVDLVETFNYLLGIEVKKMRAFEEGGRPYRAVLGEKGGKRVVIVWRPLEGLEGDEEALMRDKAFIEGTVLRELLGEAKPDRLLVNGASFVKDAEAIEPEFYRLMFAPVGV